MLEVFTTIIGSMMGLSFLPQAWRIYRLKRSDEISIFTYAFIMFGGAVWVAYGVSVADKVIIIANICGMIGCGSVLAATLYYRKKVKKS